MNGLKSTHKELPLPPGWTSHRAPSGHLYYYNSQTKASTYKRPVVEEQPQNHPLPPPAPPHLPSSFSPVNGSSPYGASPAPSHDYAPNSAFPAGPQGPARFNHYNNNNQFNPRKRERYEPKDRPRSKHTIPGCAPWLLVKTRLGRRFVHNPVTGESFWKIPKDVIGGVLEFDIRERMRAAGEPVDDEDDEDEQPQALGESRPRPNTDAAAEQAEAEQALGRGDEERIWVPPKQAQQVAEDDEEEVEYEEVEVTDDEYDDAENPPKRLRGYDEAEGEEDEEEDAAAEAPAAAEFGEDDIAWQLAQMGAANDLDPGEYDAGDDAYYEEGAEGIGLTEEECNASFKDMLNDFGVNPYKTWDSIIEEGAIVQDDRYTLLPNMAARRKVFADWSSSTIQALKEEKAKMAKQDPRIPYLDLLARFASPKLFWPEFRRKFKKEPEMKDMKLPEKEKEKLYREHINRVTKMSETMLKSDLETLLKSIPPSRTWNRETSLEVLPAQILADVKFISLKPAIRDGIVESVIKRLPRKDDLADAEEGADARQARAERAKRDEALRERQRRVEEDKRRQQRDLQHGRRALREGEEELNRAMRVGKDGLRGALAD